MPPQRRKIVPPTTTSKGRRKVAGSGRKPVDGAAAEAPEATDAAVLDATASDATASDAAASDATAVESSASASPVPASPVPLTKSGATEAAATESAKPSKPSKPSKSAKTAVPTETAETPDRRTSWVPAIAVGVVAVVLAGFAVFAALKSDVVIDNQAWVDQNATSEVTRSTTDALTALYKYSYETIDDDIANARTFMGQQMLDETDQFLDAIKSGAQQTQTATEVDVMDLGVTRLETDKAELLANLNVSSTRAGVAFDNAMFPMVVNMDKVDGKWVVSGTELK